MTSRIILHFTGGLRAIFACWQAFVSGPNIGEQIKKMRKITSNLDAITFDTLKLAQRLRDEAKYTPEQAENIALILSETLSEWNELQKHAIIEDLTAFKLETECAIETARIKTKEDIITWFRW